MESINNNSYQAEKKVYTVKEIATILGISIRGAYDLCNKTVNFKVIRLGKKSIRVNKESFDQWFSDL